MAVRPSHEPQEELLYLEQELEALIRQTHDGVLIADANGQVLTANQACATIMGIPYDRLIAEGPVVLAQKGYLPDAVLPQVLVQKDKVTRVLTYQSGREAIVTCTPIFDRQGEVSRIICTMRDLTSTRPEPLNLGKSLAQDYSKQLAEFLSAMDKVSIEGNVVRSPQMREVMSRALRAAQIDSNVLLTGETGVGKDLIARVIHKKSHRSMEGQFIKVDCAAIPEQLLEAELFGYEGGAFTDARREGKAGLIELAHRGTLFLDEIGELPLGLQAKLLNVLQDHRLTRVGGIKPKEVDFRLIAATNRDLEAAVGEGKFRQDLFYRLNVIRIHIPPLRERRDDILPLVAHFTKLYTETHALHRIISAQVLEFFMDYDWPGNVRELANVIERLVVMSTGEVITLDDLAHLGSFRHHEEGTWPGWSSAGPKKTLKQMLEDYERKVIQDAIAHHFTLRQAAESLGIDLSTLTRKKKKLGIK
ncbi:MAG: sigma 54-interacting transcriptional regulator [Clostridia bacterium]|nr:sigma 54-interacting transcriptional regulator [Clostridia bacterium]